MFHRNEANTILTELVAQIQNVPLVHYLQATHVEARLVSVGDILIAVDNAQ